MLAQRTRDQTFQKLQLNPYRFYWGGASSILLAVLFILALSSSSSTTTTIAGEAQDMPFPKIGGGDVVGVEEEDYSCRLQGGEIGRRGGVGGGGDVGEEGGAGLEEEGN